MLDITIPKDTDPIASLAKVLRDTRAAIVKDGIAGVVFENGVQNGDAVFLDQDMNIWRMSRAGHPTRNVFHGIANLDQQAVLIFGFYRDDRWAFVPGETVFVSSTNNGELTTEVDTGLIAGVAASFDYLLLDSQISAAFGRLRDEILTSRGDYGTLNLRIVADENRTAALEAEITTARAGEASLGIHLSQILTEIVNARGTYSTLVDQINSLLATQAEVNSGRVGKVTLRAKIDDMDTLHGSLASEVVTARGSALSLGAFLSIAHNPDGSLKATITATTWNPMTGTVTRISDTVFTVGGDMSALTAGGPGRSLQVDGVQGIYVLSAVYNPATLLTTVTVQRGVLPATVTSVSYGFSKYELPLYGHADLYGIQTVDETSTDTTKNKHVSNAQVKSWVDLVTSVSTIPGNGTVPKANSTGNIDAGFLPDQTTALKGGVRRAKFYELFTMASGALSFTPSQQSFREAISTKRGGSSTGFVMSDSTLLTLMYWAQ